jgi:hypothetical protein
LIRSRNNVVRDGPQRRKSTNGICRCRIARQKKCLAAAAAKISRAAVATPAGFRHPVLAAKFLEYF